MTSTCLLKMVFPWQHLPERLLLGQQLLPFLADLALYLDFDLAKLMTSQREHSLSVVIVNKATNFFFFPAQLLLLEAHALCSELFGKNRRVAVYYCNQ
jgi:hypothetical protein